MPPLSRRQPRQRGREERGPGYPLFSCREVPMNFATLNKKWFHEVNISVTIPSPTRGAHARIARRQRRAGSDGRVYTFTDASRTLRIRAHILALARPRARWRSHSLPLALLLFFAYRAALRRTSRGYARTREDSHTRVHKRAARVKNEGSERGTGRTEGRRKKKSSPHEGRDR